MHPDIARHQPGIANICQRFCVRRLDIFGSAARGGDFAGDASDADFLVEFAPDAHIDVETFLSAKLALESLLGRPVDLVEAGSVRNPFVLASVNGSRELVYAA